MTQDEHLPESSIRKFGIDMVQGLHHIHSLGIVFSDLKPSKVDSRNIRCVHVVDILLQQEYYSVSVSTGEYFNTCVYIFYEIYL